MGINCSRFDLNTTRINKQKVCIWALTPPPLHFFFFNYDLTNVISFSFSCDLTVTHLVPLLDLNCCETPQSLTISAPYTQEAKTLYKRIEYVF